MTDFIDIFSSREKALTIEGLASHLSSLTPDQRIAAQRVVTCMVENSADGLRVRYEYLVSEGFEFQRPGISFLEGSDNAITNTVTQGLPLFLQIWKQRIPSVYFVQSDNQSADLESKFRNFRLFSAERENSFWSLDYADTKVEVVDGTEFIDLGLSPSTEEWLGIGFPCNIIAPLVLNEPPIPLLVWLEDWVQRGTLTVSESEQFLHVYRDIVDVRFFKKFMDEFTKLPFDFWSSKYL